MRFVINPIGFYRIDPFMYKRGQIKLNLTTIDYTFGKPSLNSDTGG